ncbi:phage virion morphogenesis protein [uncultured Halomonas sp.]|uniref:phage virion morphogenesis protein n=1 Tax=uncultured Halomonas sp. TaxID=173971 RepID=UPI0026039FAD|nr:phage virion morphogenesis protein [uncultured Halomonas sp.]
MIEVQVDDAELTAALERLSRTYADSQSAFQDAGELLMQSTKKRFKDKTAPDGSPWPANAPITEAAKGKNNPLVGESKRLGREIHYRARDNLLEIGSPLEYAAAQHFGARRGAFGSTAQGRPIPWGNIPPRAFLGLSDDDRKGVLQVMEEHVRGLWDLR